MQYSNENLCVLIPTLLHWAQFHGLGASSKKWELIYFRSRQFASGTMRNKKNSTGVCIYYRRCFYIHFEFDLGINILTWQTRDNHSPFEFSTNIYNCVFHSKSRKLKKMGESREATLFTVLMMLENIEFAQNVNVLCVLILIFTY